jgi:uncharacterized membrane protein
MPVKDYYKILELPPTAGEEEVKRNFRRLAIRFHPDTNGGKKQADAWYREIQEAYLVLSNPGKKSQYLQERWLLKSKGLPFEDTTPLTPEFIELKFRAMRKTVSQMDHFRMDHGGLQKQLLALCNSANLDALQEYPDPHANTHIIGHLLYCMEPIEFALLQPLKIPMEKIARHQPDLLQSIHFWFEKRKRQHWWDTKQGWVIAAITILMCIGIAILANM